MAIVSCGRPAYAPQRPAAIAWTAWGQEPLARARQEHKLVLVDVGIEGCTACRWMNESTYRDPEVARRVTERFVAVSVDADQQPDLGERWEPWGWPATIFLDGSGAQLYALRGSEPPRSFAAILDDVLAKWQRGDLHPDAALSVARATTTTTTSSSKQDGLAVLCVEAERGLAASGWPDSRGRGPNFVYSTPIEVALLRARAYGDRSGTARAIEAASGYEKLVDREWGGVFVGSRHPDWSAPIVEKRMLQQAYALEAFAAAYRATGDERFVRAAHQVHRYVAHWMTAPDGTFYSTQRDEPPDLPATMTSGDYYALPDAERRKYGIPAIDHGVYSDQNGVVALAYVKMYEATGDDGWLGVAERAMNALLAARVRAGGWVAQAAATRELEGDVRLRAAHPDDRPFLRPQADVGLALVALYQASGNSKWLDAALGVARAMRERLEDGAGGGFFGVERRETDELMPRRKPFYENAVAARLLLSLAAIAKDPPMRASAERALVAIAPQTAGAPPTDAGHFALALEAAAAGSVEMSVVGEASDPRAVALLRAAARIDEPRKVVHFEASGRYPYHGRPAVYVCTEDQCSSPAYEPEQVASLAAPLARVRDGSGCRAP